MFEEASDQPVIPTGMGILKRTKTNKSSTVERRKSLLEKPINDIAPKKGPKAVPKLTITTKLPTGVVSVNGPASAVIEPGTITRFTVPVPKEEMGSVIPKTQKGHRRTLSYRNAVSASGVPASFLEWARMIQEEGQDLKSAAVPTPDDPNETEDFDVVKPFARHSKISPPKTIVSPDGKGQLKPSKLAPISDDGEEKEEEPEVVEPVDSPKIVFWDAVYIANDNDFLETSKIRQLFRSNAINPEDAKLFEMKEFTGEERNDQEFEIAGDAFPCESCYPTEQELTNMSPIVRFLHIHKCILLASLISILVIVFILVMMFTNFSGVSTNRPPN
jgi:hypothetical protein